MRILDNGIVRDMTMEEIELYINNKEVKDATEQDYINALEEMGVSFNG